MLITRCALASRPDMQNAIRRLMRPDDMLETFSELAVKEPDLMRLVLQASVAALVNVQSVDAEMKRRAGHEELTQAEVDKAFPYLASLIG